MEKDARTILATISDVFDGVLKEIERQENAATDEKYGEAMNKASFNDARLLKEVCHLSEVTDGEAERLWDEAEKEAIEMIACACQQIHEFRRRREAVYDDQG